jgi:hypothetical protein
LKGNITMRFRYVGGHIAACVFFATHAVAAPVTDGVPPRAITDPRAIVPPALAGAAPMPIDDLFYTRGGLDAAWLPDGKSIVVSTNITGRYNLWLVPANGGFPLQLTQSDDRQSGLTASPTNSVTGYANPESANPRQATCSCKA